MAPDADKIRQRKKVVFDNLLEDADNATLTTTPTIVEQRICTNVNEIQTNEIIIDGIIYTLNNFDHPGGGTINFFGGNDVTVQYKMIHPYHTKKHLQKMTQVGIVTNYQSEYKFDTEFEREMKREVFQIVHRGKEFGTYGWYVRAIMYIALFGYLQYLWSFGEFSSSYPLAILLGISHAMIGLNVQHDANHGAASKKPYVNEILGLGADFIGGSKWIWFIQHWTHHTYTNHPTKDPDGYAAEPFILFNSYPIDHIKRRWYHNFQAFYVLIALAGYWLSAVFHPQILDLKQRGALQSGIQMDNELLISRRKYAVLLRIVYHYLNVIRPFQHHGLSWTVCGHILLMGISGSLTLGLLFTLSHNFENCDRNPTTTKTKDGKNTTTANNEPVCWFKSQVETSCTYGGFIAGYLTGGLNFQVEHHLFPRMSSSWYPYIAPTVRKVCAKHGVKYAYYPYLWQNMISSIKYIHQAGTGELWKHIENPYSGRA